MIPYAAISDFNRWGWMSQLAKKFFISGNMSSPWTLSGIFRTNRTWPRPPWHPWQFVDPEVVRSAQERSEALSRRPACIVSSSGPGG